MDWRGRECAAPACHMQKAVLILPRAANHFPAAGCPVLAQILPKQNDKDPSRVDVDVLVREKPMQTADVEAEWSIAPGACWYALWCVGFAGCPTWHADRGPGGVGRCSG